MKKSVAEHARDVLIETDNNGVGYGDTGLLDLIADRYGYVAKTKRKDQPGRFIHNRWTAVLDGCDRRPDLFEKRLSRLRFGCYRYYVLRECIVDGDAKLPTDIGLEKTSE